MKWHVGECILWIFVISSCAGAPPARGCNAAGRYSPGPRTFRPKSEAATWAGGCPRSTRGGTVARDKQVAFEKVPRGVLHTFLSDLKSLAAAAGKALY